jgi:hypothetical protein
MEEKKEEPPLRRQARVQSLFIEEPTDITIYHLTTNSYIINYCTTHNSSSSSSSSK